MYAESMFESLLLLHGLPSEAEIPFFSLPHVYIHIYISHKMKIHDNTSVLRKKKSKKLFSLLFFFFSRKKSMRFFSENSVEEASLFTPWEKWLQFLAAL